MASVVSFHMFHCPQCLCKLEVLSRGLSRGRFDVLTRKLPMLHSILLSGDRKYLLVLFFVRLTEVAEHYLNHDFTGGLNQVNESPI